MEYTWRSRTHLPPAHLCSYTQNHLIQQGINRISFTPYSPPSWTFLSVLPRGCFPLRPIQATSFLTWLQNHIDTGWEASVHMSCSPWGIISPAFLNQTQPLATFKVIRNLHIHHIQQLQQLCRCCPQEIVSPAADEPADRSAGWMWNHCHLQAAGKASTALSWPGRGNGKHQNSLSDLLGGKKNHITNKLPKPTLQSSPKSPQIDINDWVETGWMQIWQKWGNWEKCSVFKDFFIIQVFYHLKTPIY